MAVSDSLGMLATPLRVADVRSDADAVTATCEAIRDTEAEKVVIGLPLNMDGTIGPKARQVMAFCEKLKTQCSLSIDTWDERLTSRIAERAMLEGDLSRKKRKKVRDKLAAQIILQGYLDAQANALDMR